MLHIWYQSRRSFKNSSKYIVNIAYKNLVTNFFISTCKKLFNRPEEYPQEEDEKCATNPATPKTYVNCHNEGVHIYTNLSNNNHLTELITVLERQMIDSTKKVLPVIAIGSTTIVVSGIALLYTFQRNLIYTSHYPVGSRKNVPKPTEFGIPYSQVILITEDNVLIRAFGSGGNMGHRLPIAEKFYKDFKYYLLRDTNLIIYGQSLGGAVAIDLVSRNESKVNALIIENTFLSIQKAIPFAMPTLRYLKFLFSEIWPSEINITKINEIPILFISGTNDEIIPPQQMKTLFELTNTKGGKVWREIPGGTHEKTVTKPRYFEFIVNTSLKCNTIKDVADPTPSSIYLNLAF
ncbi:524_t:CDS:10 [Diversispora eburnea]|uniref:524_t:CDS:1 n=1 Tax=Diversispora eburnea TaxID=1213867 RepID=A0A9N8UZE6_9GLOM|nr:524_t:CDS:10 [Diversispora eburnea]